VVILFFCLAALLSTYVPALASFDRLAFSAGRLGLTATLFLIGTGISIETIKLWAGGHCCKVSCCGSWLRRRRCT